MQNQENHHQRKSIRLQEYDYARPGAYFVTVVSHRRKNIFGEIIDGELDLNRLGLIVEKNWEEIPIHFPNANVDSHVVMPNHFHGIIIINEVGAQHAEPLRHAELQIKAQPLGVIIRSFKSAVTKRVHDLGLFVGEKIWQRNYYEHIIRDEDDSQQIVDYVASNPSNWEFDRENPENIKPFSRTSLK